MSDGDDIGQLISPKTIGHGYARNRETEWGEVDQREESVAEGINNPSRQWGADREQHGPHLCSVCPVWLNRLN